MITVLLVEDDLLFTYLIERYAARGGFMLVSTTRGEEALALAQSEKPAVIVLDIMLPGMDGWEVLRLLKSSPATRDIPVVLCSALDEEARGLEAGADGYLHKPVLYRDFLAMLEEVEVLPRA